MNEEKNRKQRLEAESEGFYEVFEEIDRALNAEIQNKNEYEALVQPKVKENKAPKKQATNKQAKKERPPLNMDLPPIDESWQKDFYFTSSYLSELKEKTKETETDRGIILQQEKPFSDEFIYEQAKKKRKVKLRSVMERNAAGYHRRQRIFSWLILSLMIVGVGLFYHIRKKQLSNNPDWLYTQALENHSQENYLKAINLYQKFIEKFPEDERIVEAKFALAGCFDMLGNFEQALKTYKELVSFYPSSPRAPIALFLMGECNMKLKKYQKARDIWRTFEKEYPENYLITSGRVKEKMAQSFFLEKKYLEVISLYKELLEQRGSISGGEEKWQIAQCWEALGNKEQAVACYKSMINDFKVKSSIKIKAEERLVEILSQPEDKH